MDKIGYLVMKGQELEGYSIIYGTHRELTASHTRGGDLGPSFCSLAGPYDTLKEAKRQALDGIQGDIAALRVAQHMMLRTTAKWLKEDYHKRREEHPDQ